MAPIINKSSAQKALENAEKLRVYIKSTALEDIPKNQHKCAARNPILKSLGIPPSTAGTNKSLQDQFAKLDAALGNAPRTEIKDRSSDIRKLKARINTLENRIVSHKAENEELRSKLKAYEHFEATGRMVRL